MRITKLDRRHNGYKDFKYSLGFASGEADRFIEIRTWAWETFGASCELKLWGKTIEPVWCWNHDDWNTRLYFATDKELNWYKLRWGV